MTWIRHPRRLALSAAGLLSLLTSGCCIEYQQGSQVACPWPRTEDSGPAVFDHHPERCDGLDNDFDGLVDEGYPDVDGDGAADCTDGECTIELAEGDDLGEEHQCTVDLLPPEDPWAVEILWESESEVGACREGVIAVDVDGNGISDVLCAGPDELVAFSGESGEILWTSQVLDSYSPLAAADLDGDGAMDIVGFDPEGRVVCLDGAGAVKWRGDADIARFGFSDDGINIEIADLWGRGQPEIVTNLGIASGHDGGVLAALEYPLALRMPSHRLLAVGDIDQNGTQEILDRAWVYGPDGRLKWSIPLPDTIQRPCPCPTLVQADEDDQAEIVFHTTESLLIAEHDGTLSAEVLLSEVYWSSTCAGDVDGDGEMETVFADRQALWVFDGQGNQEWSTPVQDSSDGYMGCSVFDFDLDGAEEILLGDWDDFFIFDGRTGSILYQDPSRSSGTIGEIPLVVDLDGDGSVEIVMPNSGAMALGDSAIRVYTNTNHDWPPGSPIWPSATWSGTSLFLDGSIPRTPEASWLTTKVWRGQPEFIIPGMDLRPEITDSCVSSCEPEGAVRLAVRLVNRGPQEVQRGATLAVYTLDTQGERQLLGTRVYTDFIDNRWASAAQQITVTTEQALNGIVIVAGDEGGQTITIEDCDQDNNTLTWRLDVCD